MKHPNFITDEEVDHALHRLHNNAEAIGKAKADQVRTEAMTKHIVALEMKKYNHLPVSAQKREAEASQAYIDALNKEAEAAGEFEKRKAETKADEMLIDAWRSMGANYRAIGKLG